MNRSPDALVTTRTALILLLAVVSGCVVGFLTYLADWSAAAAVLAGVVAVGPAVTFFHWIVDPGPPADVDHVQTTSSPTRRPGRERPGRRSSR